MKIAIITGSGGLITMFDAFYQNPRVGEVYNAGGGRFSNCSMLEAIKMSELITGNAFNFSYSEQNRIGDHIWYISDTSKFKNHFPEWRQEFGIEAILHQIFKAYTENMKI